MHSIKDQILLFTSNSNLKCTKVNLYSIHSRVMFLRLFDHKALALQSRGTAVYHHCKSITSNKMRRRMVPLLQLPKSRKLARLANLRDLLPLTCKDTKGPRGSNRTPSNRI
jgi:hypothetical protein